jgi:hypothetical protein
MTADLLKNAAWEHFFQKEAAAKKRDCALVGAQAEPRYGMGSLDTTVRTDVEFKCTASKCMRWMTTSKNQGFCLATIPAETAHLIFSSMTGLKEPHGE